MPRPGRPGKRAPANASEGAVGAERRAGPASGQRPREWQRLFAGGRREVRREASTRRRRRDAQRRRRACCDRSLRREQLVKSSQPEPKARRGASFQAPATPAADTQARRVQRAARRGASFQAPATTRSATRPAKRWFPGKAGGRCRRAARASSDAQSGFLYSDAALPAPSRHVRGGPVRERQRTPAKGPKAPSAGPDRRATRGRESGSACLQAGAVKRDAKRAPGAAVATRSGDVEACCDRSLRREQKPKTSQPEPKPRRGASCQAPAKPAAAAQRKREASSDARSWFLSRATRSARARREPPFCVQAPHCRRRRAASGAAR